MNGPPLTLDRLERSDMKSAARIHRIAFDTNFPWLAGLHTPEEDCDYWTRHLFDTAQIWGAKHDGHLRGVAAVEDGWIRQLYVDPAFQGKGAGSALLKRVQSTSGELQLWTFQCNLRARHFYESHGFQAIATTDGRDNEEHEPDILYQWRRTAMMTDT